MARMNDTFKIKFEIEPIVKLACINMGCRFNIKTHCNLKHLTIVSGGKCKDYTEVNKE